YATGLHQSHPALHAALALAHADFQRLLGNGLVRENADPELAGAFDVALDRHTARLDLARGQGVPAGGLQRVITERHVGAAPGNTAVLTRHHLTELGTLRRKHVSASVGNAASLALQDLALENPYLDADDAVGGAGFGESEIHVGAQRVERHTPLTIGLDASHLRAAQAPCATDADALGPELHGRRQRLLHGATEGDAAFELG